MVVEGRAERGQERSSAAHRSAGEAKTPGDGLMLAMAPQRLIPTNGSPARGYREDGLDSAFRAEPLPAAPTEKNGRAHAGRSSAQRKMRATTESTASRAHAGRAPPRRPPSACRRFLPPIAPPARSWKPRRRWRCAARRARGRSRRRASSWGMCHSRALCDASTMFTAYMSAMILRSRSGTTRSRYTRSMPCTVEFMPRWPMPADSTMKPISTRASASSRSRIYQFFKLLLL